MNKKNLSHETMPAINWQFSRLNDTVKYQISTIGHQSRREYQLIATLPGVYSHIDIGSSTNPKICPAGVG